jgi:hypothetical protein
LIGTQEERLRDREPERLGGLEIDHELEQDLRNCATGSGIEISSRS